jgi:hypothetical protein
MVGRFAGELNGHATDMKTKKTVTEKVLAANRANARKSTGPRDASAVSQNARKHGLLARSLRFETQDEREEFQALLLELETDQQPGERAERVLIEELATCIWKVGLANHWEVEEQHNSRAASQSIMQTLADNDDHETLPFFANSAGSASAAQRGWDCHELFIRSSNTDSEHDNAFGDRHKQVGQIHIEAKLGTRLETIQRYQAAIKRDLYRVLAALREMKRERREEG